MLRPSLPARRPGESASLKSFLSGDRLGFDGVRGCIGSCASGGRARSCELGARRFDFDVAALAVGIPGRYGSATISRGRCGDVANRLKESTDGNNFKLSEGGVIYPFFLF